MRIAAAIIALFLTIIILVQSAAAGTADALSGKGSVGTFGFFVAVFFVIGAALMFGKVMKAALAVWLLTIVVAWAGAASTIFGDLWVWGFVALLYASGIGWGLWKAQQAPNGGSESRTASDVPRPAEQAVAGSQSSPVPNPDSEGGVNRNLISAYSEPEENAQREGVSPEVLSASESSAGTDDPQSPLDIARERYARGEITREEFQQLTADLA